MFVRGGARCSYKSFTFLLSCYCFYLHVNHFVVHAAVRVTFLQKRSVNGKNGIAVRTFDQVYKHASVSLSVPSLTLSLFCWLALFFIG